MVLERDPDSEVASLAKKILAMLHSKMMMNSENSSVFRISLPNLSVTMSTLLISNCPG